MYYVQALNRGQEKTPVPFAFHIHPNQSSTQASLNISNPYQPSKVSLVARDTISRGAKASTAECQTSMNWTSI